MTINRRLLIIPAIAAALALFAGVASAQDGPPGPSAGTVLTAGLIAPRGMTLGPDGMIYIAEAGTGGDTEFEAEDGSVVKNGFTGRVSKVDPATGTRTTVADGLPSQLGPMGDTVGPADVAFVGNTLYYLQTHGGEGYGFPDTPTGIYRIAANGDTNLVANIGEFNIENPTTAITDGSQLDIETGGNPYSMIVRDSVFYVSDGNHNRLLRVTTAGAVSAVAEFPNHPVSTGIAETESGLFYVGYLGLAPFLPQDGKVVSVSPGTGDIVEVASGVPMITDVAVGTGDQLYALSFSEGFAPFTGKVLRVEDDGTLTTLVAGLTFTSDMMFIGDTLYVVDDGLSALGPGEIIEIENFSSVQPPAPAPTAAPTTAPPVATATRPSGVVAPNTGSGSDGGSSSGMLMLALAVGAIGLASGGAALAMKRG